MEREHDANPIKTAPKIDLGPSLPATPEELERRGAVNELVTKLREEIGTIGVSVVTLIREHRDAQERTDG